MRTRALTAAFQHNGDIRQILTNTSNGSSTFTKGNLVCLDENTLAMSTKAADRSKRLQEQKTGPYKIVNVQPKTVTFEKDGNLDTVSVDRIPIAQRKNKISSSVLIARKVDGSDEVNLKRAEAITNKQIGNEEEIDNDHPGSNENNADEHVVDQIVHQSLERGRMFYRVWWYEYSPDDDTLELVKSIPDHFIRR